MALTETIDVSSVVSESISAALTFKSAAAAVSLNGQWRDTLLLPLHSPSCSCQLSATDIQSLRRQHDSMVRAHRAHQAGLLSRSRPRSRPCRRRRRWWPKPRTRFWKRFQHASRQSVSSTSLIPDTTESERGRELRIDVARNPATVRLSNQF